MLWFIGIFILLLSLGGILIVVLKNVPKTANVPDYEINYLSRGPFWRVVLRFLTRKQKVVTKVLITKTIRRLKVISLKTDNLASSLLKKIQSREEDK